jgi:protein-S-isoprenylcysteine O-methyltransferase Ste14
MTASELTRAAVLRISAGMVIWGGLFFGTAGTLRYWQAWLFLGTLFLPMLLIVGYLIRNDPELAERRLRAREKRSRQKLIITLTSLAWLVGFLIPGLDQRFGWSAVPTWAVLLADLLFLAGYLLFFLVLRENSYAGRTIQVDEGQTVISTGPYARVRHPMYSSTLLMMVFAPVALGSWWAALPMLLLTPPFLVLRIRDEEAALLEELPGYREYTQETTYRLIPGVW